MIGDPLTDALMRTVLIVVSDVFPDDLLDMLTISEENVIQAFPSQTAHEPFANSIRTRRSIRRLQFLDPRTNCHCRKVRGIFTVTIANQILWSPVLATYSSAQI